MKKILLLLFILTSLLSALFLKDYWWKQTSEIVTPFVQFQERPSYLDAYSFENLRLREFVGSTITLEKIMKEESNFTSYLFSFKSDGKKVTGQLNLPKGKDKFPVVVMVRGHIDNEVYFTGAGTYKAAAIFAQNGFITLAPDFLGFGGSDTPSSDVLEARFEKPITVLNLLSSIGTLPQADTNNVFLWGHSNGGQISLSVLEVSQKPIPTTLWAPVTKGFPTSILAYMNEMDDSGLKVRNAIELFLRYFDANKYSIANYFADIQAPIQIHQGTIDDLVPLAWSDAFVSQMESLGKKITYYKYRGADHNLKQSWDLVVARDLEFFRKNLKE